MKKLTTSVLTVVLSATFAVANAQQDQDTTRVVNVGEVVITGALGIKKRADAVTSANQVVNAQEIQAAKNPNVVQALTGKVSGLQINTTNTSVNSTNRVVLRGPRSISGNNEALIVIDGAISTMTIFQNLPPEIVDNVNVIKGQQGAALYGERGSNGVIIVTTKRGSRSEKLQFNLTSAVEFTSAYKLPIIQKVYGQGWPGDVFDLTDYGGTNWVPYENTNWGPAYSSALGGQDLYVGLPQANGQFLTQKFAPVKDPIGNFFQTGMMFQNGLSVNAGDQDGYVFFSVNRTDSEFIVEKDVLKRNNFILKAGKQLGKFRIDGNINFLDLNTYVTDSDLYDDLIQTPSNVDVRKFRNSLPDASYTAYALNPYWTINNERFNTKNRTFTGLLNLKYDLTDHINLTYTGSATSTAIDRESHRNKFIMDRVYSGTGTYVDGQSLYDFGQEDVISNYFKSSSNIFTYYGDFMANFDYDLTDNLNFKLNLGFNNQDRRITNMEVGGNNLEIDGWYHINNVLQPAQWSTLDNTSYRKRSFAYFANLDLDYKQFLFFNSTFRYEKSSVLSIRTPQLGGLPDVFRNQGYPYYSFGLSFVPTKAFPSIKGDILNYAKISLAHTRVGNSFLSEYQADQVGVIPTGYPFGNLSSYLPATSQVSPDINPEFTFSNEASLQLGFFKDRVTFEGSVYKTKTDDLITGRTVSAPTGITQLIDNIGLMENKGFELDLGLVPLKFKDFEWRLRGSYSTYKSIVKSLEAGATEVALLTTSTPSAGIFAIVGEDMPMIKGTKYLRDPNGNIIVGANGNPLSTSTLEILGKVNPDYILGFGTSIKYKGIRLSATADYRTGNKFLSLTKNLLGFTGGLEKTAEFDRSKGYIIPGSVQNTGTAANPVYVTNTTPVSNAATYTGVNAYFTGAYRSVGEEFLVDGTAFKVREISLSYDLPRDLIGGTFVDSLSLGLYARNPFIIYAKDNRNFADPETSSSSGNAGGISTTGQYPTVRTFGFNINATF